MRSKVGISFILPCVGLVFFGATVVLALGVQPVCCALPVCHGAVSGDVLW